MNISFENNVALVTGAASGLGLATAKSFAESGASVALADWNEEAVRAAGELADQVYKTLAMRCDVADDAEADQMVASGQGDALEAMTKSIPMGRQDVPKKSRMRFSGFAATLQATSPASPFPWMADSSCAESE